MRGSAALIALTSTAGTLGGSGQGPRSRQFVRRVLGPALLVRVPPRRLALGVRPLLDRHRELVRALAAKRAAHDKDGRPGAVQRLSQRSKPSLLVLTSLPYSPAASAAAFAASFAPSVGTSSSGANGTMVGNTP